MIIIEVAQTKLVDAWKFTSEWERIFRGKKEREEEERENFSHFSSSRPSFFLSLALSLLLFSLPFISQLSVRRSSNSYSWLLSYGYYLALIFRPFVFSFEILQPNLAIKVSPVGV